MNKQINKQCYKYLDVWICFFIPFVLRLYSIGRVRKEGRKEGILVLGMKTCILSYHINLDTSICFQFFRYYAVLGI